MAASDDQQAAAQTPIDEISLDDSDGSEENRNKRSILCIYFIQKNPKWNAFWEKSFIPMSLGDTFPEAFHKKIMVLISIRRGYHTVFLDYIVRYVLFVRIIFTLQLIDFRNEACLIY